MELNAGGSRSHTGALCPPVSMVTGGRDDALGGCESEQLSQRPELLSALVALFLFFSCNF